MRIIAGYIGKNKDFQIIIIKDRKDNKGAAAATGKRKER